MNSQAKVLLQLVFPTYLFVLVILIIILSRYLNFFSKLLSNRNPVAALSTLIFLSYSKLLRFIIAALQTAILEYPDGSQERVWLYDGNVKYFTPSHIPRFVAAALILTAGGLFNVLLFFSQWFPRCSNWKLMKWTRNTKYIGFMDTYHAPFTPKHRYWVGLLLFALIFHNIVAAMATDTFLHVLSAGSLSVGLITINFLSNRVYKNWTQGALEVLFLLNLTIFAIGTLYVGGTKYEQQALANVSMATTFTLFVVIICFHLYKFILSKTSIWPKLTVLVKRTNNDQGRLRRAKCAKKAEKRKKGNIEMENFDEQPVVPYTDEDEEEANTNRYQTPPKIVLATRLDQLREPALDDLAPITTDDYRPAPSPSRPQANNSQGVTFTVIDPVAAV